MSFYSDLASDATALLREFGQAVTIVKKELGLLDITTGIAAPANYTYTDAIGVLVDFDYRNYGVGNSNQMISSSDKRLYMSTATEVMAADTVIVDGNSYRIVVIKVVNPAGTRVLYDLWIQT